MRSKFLILSILVCFTFTINVYSQKNKIGSVSKGKYVITGNLKELKNEWVDILKEAKVNEQLSAFEIVKRKDLTLNKYYYALMASDSTNKIKCATFLVFKNKNFYLKKTGSVFVVTCIGEMESCLPNVLQGRWICGVTTDGKCSKGCTKVVNATMY